MLQKDFKKLFNYDHASGNLSWKPRARELFKTDREFKRWNARHANKTAGGLDKSKNSGYLRVQVDGKTYQVHRVIWLMAHGSWPDRIDHINHVRTDNTLFNLRSVTNTTNRKNQTQNINSSGFVGVTWHKTRQKWQALIGVNGKVIYLGLFADKQDAIKARKSANVKYNFHPNHGK